MKAAEKSLLGIDINMIQILEVEDIFHLTGRGSVLTGTCTVDAPNNLFKNLIGSKVWLCTKDDSKIGLTVIGMDIKWPCFGNIEKPTSLNATILVNRFIDKESIGTLYRESD